MVLPRLDVGTRLPALEDSKPLFEPAHIPPHHLEMSVFVPPCLGVFASLFPGVQAFPQLKHFPNPRIGQNRARDLWRALRWEAACSSTAFRSCWQLFNCLQFFFVVSVSILHQRDSWEGMDGIKLLRTGWYRPIAACLSALVPELQGSSW